MLPPAFVMLASLSAIHLLASLSAIHCLLLAAAARPAAGRSCLAAAAARRVTSLPGGSPAAPRSSAGQLQAPNEQQYPATFGRASGRLIAAKLPQTQATHPSHSGG
jgi:hypothetical protein